MYEHVDTGRQAGTHRAGDGRETQLEAISEACAAGGGPSHNHSVGRQIRSAAEGHCRSNIWHYGACLDDISVASCARDSCAGEHISLSRECNKSTTQSSTGHQLRARTDLSSHVLVWRSP